MKKSRKIWILSGVALCACTLLAGLAACTNPFAGKHSHALEHHEAVSPSCTEGGSYEYWSCETCDKYFWDERGREEVEEKENVARPAEGHSRYGSWEKDETEHWFSASCGHETSRGEHVWDDGRVTKTPPPCTGGTDGKGEKLYTCTECGYEKTEEYDPNPAEYHSNWNDNVCGICGADMGGSKGLEWRMYSDYAEFRGCGRCADTKIVIPEYYNGKPVRSVNMKIDSDTVTSVVIPATVRRYGTDIAIGFTESAVFNGYSHRLYGRSLREVYDLSSCAIRGFSFNFECYAAGHIAHSQSLSCYNFKTYDTAEERGRFVVQGDFTFYRDPEEKWHLISYLGEDANVVLPADIEGETYVVDSYALCSSAIESIVVSDGVTRMESKAIFTCPNLTSLSIGSGLAEAKILGRGLNFLFGCPDLSQIMVSAQNEHYFSAGNCLIERESGRLVLGCKDSVIPADGSVKAIGEGAFSVSNIESVVIPASVTSIGGFAFDGCRNLKSIVIPRTVESVSDFAFHLAADAVIYAEAESKPENWDESFTESVILWRNDWEYVDGVPARKQAE